MVIVDVVQYVCDMVKIGVVFFLWQEYWFILYCVYVWVVEVDVQYCFLDRCVIDLVFLEVDEEWFFGCGFWQIGGILVFIVQKQIFVLFEFEQCNGLLVFCCWVFVQKNGVFVLQFGEFVWVGWYYVYCVVEFGFEIGGYVQVVVGDVVEYFVMWYGGV